MHELKLAATVAATAIALVAYIPYLLDMFRGKNQPHLYTWISIFVITGVVAYLQVIGGGGLGSIPMLLGLFVDVVILFYCFRFGTKDVVFFDKVCLAITLLGVITYVLLRHQPVISLAIVSAAEVISFFPTVRKTRNAPYSESLTSYYLLILKLALILAAFKTYNLLTASYPILWIVVFVVYLAAVHRWRAKVPAPKEADQAVDSFVV